jgi:EmrB/QacA subfamily drug resistance transporter
MSTVDGSIVNIALKTIQDTFRIDLGAAQWIVLSYLLTITCLLLSMGRLGDMIGRRRVYLAGFALFTVASALCGLAWNVESLIAFRVLKGIGAAMVQALGPALLVAAFPPQQRGTALGFIGMIVAAGISVGPIVGGILLNNFGWPSIFFVNIPIGIAALFLSLRALPNDNQRSSQRFDIPGALLLGVAMLLILLGLTEAETAGLLAVQVFGMVFAGILFMLAFVWWERRAPAPMINLSIFAERQFTLALSSAVGAFIALAFNFLIMPFYLQNVLGFNPQQTGLTLIASPIALSLTSPLSGPLSDRFGTRWLAAFGMLLAAIGLGSLATLTAESSQFDVMWRLAIGGAGFGIFQSPNSSTIMGSAPKSALGVASSLIAVMRTLGQTAGLALAGAIWALGVALEAGQRYEPVTSAPPAALVSGMQLALTVAAGIAALAIIPALLRSGRTEPAPSQVRN